MNQPSEVDDLDGILTEAFNSFYDYITEPNLLKAAEEYDKKTSYRVAKEKLKALIASKVLEARIDEQQRTSLDDGEIVVRVGEPGLSGGHTTQPFRVRSLQARRKDSN